MAILCLSLLFLPAILVGFIAHLVWVFLRMGWRGGIDCTEWLGRRS